MIEIGKTAAAAAASMCVCVSSVTASSVGGSDIGTARIRVRSIEIRGCNALILAVPRGIIESAIDSSGDTDTAVHAAGAVLRPKGVIEGSSGSHWTVDRVATS